MVPTAEMTVVLEPLALVVTVTTAGRVAVVVRMVGCAIVVTGMAESHLLFLFWISVTAVLAVLVLVAVALVVVPFLVPVTNSIWRGERTMRPLQRRVSISCVVRLSAPRAQEFGITHKRP